MKKLPFKQHRVGETLIREFRQDVSSSELTWHRDREDRLVVVREGTGWMLQIENRLPEPLSEGSSHFIPKNTYHRIIKGTTGLVVEITEDNAALRACVRGLLAEATGSPCTNATVRAIATHFGDEDKLPHPDDEVCDRFTSGIDVHMTLTRELGYKTVNITRWWQRSAMEGWRPTLKKFIADHPEGVYYLSSRDHAMALIDGVLTDTAEFRKLGNVILTSGEKLEK